jgi:predicted DNA-binding protein with PD1-like motif
MESRLLASEPDGTQSFVLVFETGDEATAELDAFARAQNLSAASLRGIGAFSDVVLGYFDWQKKDYEPIRVDEQVEVLSLLGDIALKDGAPAVHVHVVVAGRDGAARGGHLLEAHVRPTLEVVVTESPAHLRKRYDEASGLALISLEETGTPQGEANLPRVPEGAGTLVGGQAQQLVEDEAATPRGSSEEGAGLES